MAMQVPEDTSVRLQALPAAQQRSAASAEMLAGGEVRPARDISQTLGQLGRAGTEFALKRQNDRNLAAVAAADAALGTHQLEFEQQAKSRRGWQADGLGKDTAAFWDKAASDTMAGLENDAQRRAMAGIIAKKRVASLERMGNHQQDQLDKAMLDSLNASVANDIDHAAANASDPAETASAISDITRKSNAIAAARGWDSQQLEAYRAQQHTAAHKAVIGSLLQQDAVKAKIYYEANKDQIAGSERAAIEKNIETASRLGRAQEASDKIAAQGGTLTEQLDKARQIEDPEERKMTTELVRNRAAQTVAAVKADQSQAFDDTAKILAGGGDREAIPAATWNRLSGADQLKVEKILSDRAKQVLKPDPARSLQTYFALRDAALQDPEGFRQENLDMYIGVVDPTKLTELKKLQEKPDEITTVRTRTGIVSAAAGSIGLNPKKLDAKGDDGDEVRAFYGRVDEEIASQESITGRRVTNTDVQNIVDRLTIQVIREGKWFGREKPAAQLEIEGVPANMVDDLAKAVRDAGQPVTDANIKALYTYLNSRGRK